jgi:hypothetical protein
MRKTRKGKNMSELVLHDVTKVEITPNGIGSTIWTTLTIVKSNNERFEVIVFHNKPVLEIINNPSKQAKAA